MKDLVTGSCLTVAGGAARSSRTDMKNTLRSTIRARAMTEPLSVSYV